jgi:hypothetical protein
MKPWLARAEEVGWSKRLRERNRRFPPIEATGLELLPAATGAGFVSTDTLSVHRPSSPPIRTVEKVGLPEHPIKSLPPAEHKDKREIFAREEKCGLGTSSKSGVFFVDFPGSRARKPSLAAAVSWGFSGIKRERSHGTWASCKEFLPSSNLD